MTTQDRLNLGLAIVGILVSTAGFVITLFQLRKTRSAVEAGETATRAALNTLSARLTISELADMRVSIRAVQTALRGNRYETALIQVQAVLDQLYALRSRPGFESDDRHASIQEIVVQLAKLRNRLESKIATASVSLSVPNANNMLAEFGSTLSIWSEELRFKTIQEES